MKHYMLSLICMTSIMLSGGEIFDFGKKFIPHNNFIEQDSSAIITSGLVISAKRLTGIDADKVYTVSCRVRAVPGANKTTAYIGFQQFDEAGRSLLPEYYRLIPDSQAKLLKSAVAGSLKLEVSPPKAYHSKIVSFGWQIAMDSDGGNETLPNFNVSRIKEATRSGDVITLTLQEPLREDWSAGTPVCFHTSGPGMYPLLNGKEVSSEWMVLTAKVTGCSIVPGVDKWWRDAASAALLLSVKSIPGQKGESGLEITDIKVEISDK
ncbi:MAG: hypothetical protein GX946_03795 [Oligosphaeraceae bacterium]|nr:hypothetical protein [Oligosphaeraceae bacterium]